VGFVHVQRGEPEKAVKALRKAIRQDPKFVQALSSLSSAYFMTAELDLSLLFTQYPVALAPRLGPAYNNMALVHMERGEYAKAREYLDKAVETGFEPHPGLVRELAEKLGA
jgi:tetratricopeptide (TPR) repeat protein